VETAAPVLQSPDAAVEITASVLLTVGPAAATALLELGVRPASASRVETAFVLPEVAIAPPTEAVAVAPPASAPRTAGLASVPANQRPVGLDAALVAKPLARSAAVETAASALPTVEPVAAAVLPELDVNPASASRVETAFVLLEVATVPLTGVVAVDLAASAPPMEGLASALAQQRLVEDVAEKPKH